VTGASRGIGQATAALLAREGYKVVGTARKPQGHSVSGYEMVPLDVTSGESVKSCVTAVLQRAGRIDVLVNNAAEGLIGATEETSVEEAIALYEANFFGAARMINAVLPGMRQRRNGLIINFGSAAATLPIPFHGYLSSSKAAITTLSDALRLEVKSLGIAVTVVEPGAVATHPGELFTELKVAGSIRDYAEQQQRAVLVIEHGQTAGSSPKVVAKAVLKIIRTEAPARYYLVGAERWYLRLSRILPPSVIESLMTRHFHLAS
jgi:short-subunit dehydrogenase